MGGYYYITSQGDTWDYIAWRVYGDEYQAPLLLQANPQYLTIYLFDAGVRIWCPETEAAGSLEDDSEALPDWRMADGE